ncbi:MAG: hypothetical protein ACOH5I_05470 [Oligoflexus sp.]
MFGVRDEAFIWNCGVFYQQCLDEVAQWDEIFDEMLTNPVHVVRTKC